MRIYVPNLVELLRNLPRFEYVASNGVHIKLSDDGRQIKMWLETGEITDLDIDTAVREAFGQ